MVHVFGNIGQQREPTEGPYHRNCFIGAEPVEECCQLAIIVAVATTLTYSQAADALHQFVGGWAVLVTNHVTEQATEEADVLIERCVFVGGHLGHGGDDTARADGCGTWGQRSATVQGLNRRGPRQWANHRERWRGRCAEP